RQGGLKLGVGLGLGIDQTMDMVFEFRTEVFGLFASAQVTSVQATNAGSEFVDPGFNGGTSPTENRFGLAGGTVAVVDGRLRLELPTPIPSKQLRSGYDGLNDVFRE